DCFFIYRSGQFVFYLSPCAEEAGTIFIIYGFCDFAQNDDALSTPTRLSAPLPIKRQLLTLR
ncbi:MAG: hypothetical protein LBN25_03690, partial [Christensenellaceae bacterium]|nr:hypothetical protein [Christensenellaceae bacterium]